MKLKGIVSSLFTLCLVTLNMFVSNADTKVQPLEKSVHSLPFNKTIKGDIRPDDQQQIYKVIVKKPGRLKFHIVSYVDYKGGTGEIETYLDDNNLYDNKLILHKKSMQGSSMIPGKDTRWIDVESGEYYFYVQDRKLDKNEEGEFTIKAEFSPANNNENEPNNGTVNAHKLQLNSSVRGFINGQDMVDYYELNIPTKSTIIIDVESYLDGYKDYDHGALNLSLDNDNQYDDKFYFNENIRSTSKAPSKFRKEITLYPGKYYLRAQDNLVNGDDSGVYNLKILVKSSKSLTKDIYRYDAGKGKYLTYINGKGYSQYSYLNTSGKYAFTPSSWMTAAGLTVTMPTSSNGYTMKITNPYKTKSVEAQNLLDDINEGKVTRSSIMDKLNQINNIETESVSTDVQSRASINKTLTKDIYRYDAGKGNYLTYINGKGYSQYSYLNTSGKYAFTPSSWMTAAGLTVTMPTSSNGYTMKITNTYISKYNNLVKKIEEQI